METKIAIKSMFDNGPPGYDCQLGWSDDLMPSYLRGYEAAVQLLLAQVAGSRSGLDTLIFPIMFNYRHYLELSVKQLHWQADQVLYRASIKTFKQPRFVKFQNKSHKLGNIWDELEKKLKLIDQNVPDSLFYQIRKTIEEFNGMDESSMSFRYPEDKDWERSFNSRQSLNTYSVLENFKETKSQLDRLICWLGSMIETRSINP